MTRSTHFVFCGSLLSQCREYTRTEHSTDTIIISSDRSSRSANVCLSMHLSGKNLSITFFLYGYLELTKVYMIVPCSV